MRALIIDDEPAITTLIGTVLRNDGWEVAEAASAEQAFRMLQDQKWAVVFCDVQLGGADGFSVLRRFKDEMPQTKVVLMTGYATAEGALDATAFGAYDYLLKPFGLDELLKISQTLREQVQGSRSRRTRSQNGPSAPTADTSVLGCSEAFIDVMKQVGRVATTNLPVLLSGESGTGKEVVALSLHRHSNRATQPFIAVNCGAISAELIESELFGHMRGSFTGADRDRSGLWEAADKGTMFLDEITETTPAFQVKLLRALQQGEIRRVGSNVTARADVRVIAASNRNVEEEVAAGRFRSDLFYRLNAVSIILPPLRERTEDIPLLANSFAKRVYCQSPAVQFSPEVLQLLQVYPWPGNIRELENAMVRAAAICDGTIRTKDLPERLQQYCRFQAHDRSQLQIAEISSVFAVEEWSPLSVIQECYVEKVLAKTEGNKQAASRLLGIDRKTLERIMKRNKTVVQRTTSA